MGFIIDSVYIVLITTCTCIFLLTSVLPALFHTIVSCIIGTYNCTIATMNAYKRLVCSVLSYSLYMHSKNLCVAVQFLKQFCGDQTIPLSLSLSLSLSLVHIFDIIICHNRCFLTLVHHLLFRHLFTLPLFMIVIYLTILQLGARANY